MLDLAAFRIRFLAIVLPSDRFARDNLGHVVAHAFVKHRIASFLRPRSIVETGVRAGYSAWALALGLSPAYTGIDNDADGNGPAFRAHAAAILSPVASPVTFLAVDTRALPALPPADLFHLDADHTAEGVSHELALAAAACLPGAAILVDDIENPEVPDVRPAVEQFVAHHPEFLPLFARSWRGEALLIRQ